MSRKDYKQNILGTKNDFSPTTSVSSTMKTMLGRPVLNNFYKIEHHSRNKASMPVYKDEQERSKNITNILNKNFLHLKDGNLSDTNAVITAFSIFFILFLILRVLRYKFLL